MKVFKVRLGDDPNVELDDDTKSKGYTGHAMIRVACESERLAKSMEMARSASVLQNGELTEANVEASARVFKEAREAVEAISVSIGGDDAITDIDELTYLAEWTKIALEIIGIVTNGPKSKTILRH
jgi:hypothetical protein